jgi:hypothetical protein
LIKLVEAKAPGLEKPGAFLRPIYLLQFGVRGVAVEVFGDQLWAWFKR